MSDITGSAGTPSDHPLPAPQPDSRLLAGSHLLRLWRRVKVCAVILFVLWNLFFLVLRNPLDLWWEDSLKKRYEQRSWWPSVREPFEKADSATYYYGTFFGLDQGWSMFTPELARRAPFLAARIEFTDDSIPVEILSENEPADFNRFLRFGRWRQRKLEDRLTSWNMRDQLPNTPELPLWEAYARWSIRRWREQSPADARTVARVVLLDRRIEFPKVKADSHQFAPPSITIVGVFGPDGRFLSKEEDR